MRATDLMIGDLVHYIGDLVYYIGDVCNNDVNIRVREIHEDFVYSTLAADDFYYDELEPIPLTPKILEKNGFVEKEFYSELIVGDYRIICDLHNVCIQRNGHVDLDIPIEYLHELQHSLRLCGIEKEIKL